MGLFSAVFGKPKKKESKKSNRSRKGAANQKAVKSNLPDIEIPIGSYEIQVEGLSWCRIPLSNNKDRLFSLTPRNEYQESNGWPEVGCVNVNKNGSRRTTDKNWVGYIPGSKARSLLRVVMKHGTTRVHARVDVKGNKQSITLMLPEHYR